MINLWTAGYIQERERSTLLSQHCQKVGICEFGIKTMIGITDDVQITHLNSNKANINIFLEISTTYQYTTE